MNNITTEEENSNNDQINENNSVDFKKMVEEICKNMFPGVEFTDEQLELFMKKFISSNGDDEDEDDEDDEDDESEESDDESENDSEDDDENDSDDESSDDNSEDDGSDDDNSDGSDDDSDASFDFEDDDDEDDGDFDIRNLNLSCGYCGKVIDENTDYVITPCTHFLHTQCIKNKIMGMGIEKEVKNTTPQTEEEVDQMLDKAIDEFVNKKEENEFCEICMKLF